MTEPPKWLYGYIRLKLALAKMGGFSIDKKQARINDIALVGLFYGQCGVKVKQEVIKDGADEAIDACIIGDPQHIPKGSVLSMIHEWMVQISGPNQGVK